MEVILQEDYPSLGYVGDKVVVKGGYARNFLIPRGIAVEGSSRNARILKHRLALVAAKRARLRADAATFATRVDGILLEFTLKFGDQGRAFGSVTARDIEAKLADLGVTIDRRQIRLPEPIKTGGEYKVPVKLHADVQAVMNVRVAVERPPAAPKREEPAAPDERPEEED